jgi:hypothetical protein
MDGGLDVCSRKLGAHVTDKGSVMTLNVSGMSFRTFIHPDVRSLAAGVSDMRSSRYKGPWSNMFGTHI